MRASSRWVSVAGRRHRFARGVLTVAAIAVTATAGCASPDLTESLPHPSFGERPLPAGAVLDPPHSAPSTVQCADPTASLRPFPPGESPPSPVLDRIRQRGKLVVGLDMSNNLFSFLDPRTGAIEGFDVEVAREIARDLLGDPQRVDFRIIATADRVAALRSRSVDIVAKTMSITCQRREQVTFSTVYLEAHQRILTMRGSGVEGPADLAGRRVCSVLGTTNLARIQSMQPTTTVLGTPTWADCLVVLQQRSVDAVTADDTILAGLAVQDPNLDIVGAGFSDESYGIGMNQADSDLVRQVNGTLERIRGDGTWQRLHDRWLSILGPPPAPPVPRYED